jgi:hypothetical protein
MRQPRGAKMKCAYCAEDRGCSDYGGGHEGFRGSSLVVRTMMEWGCCVEMKCYGEGHSGRKCGRFRWKGMSAYVTIYITACPALLQASS